VFLGFGNPKGKEMIQQTNAITIHSPRSPSDAVTLVGETSITYESSSDSEMDIPSCELVINGKRTGQRIKGCMLEAAFQCDVGYLVFLNNDCLFEERLLLHLVDFSGILLDTASIFRIYSTGIFSNVKIQQPDKIRFEFFSTEATWTVQVLKNTEFRMPIFSEPMGVYRPFGFRRHFVVTEIPHTKIHPPITLLLLKIVDTFRFKKGSKPNQ